MDLVSTAVFILIAILLVMTVLGIFRFWKGELNMSEEDVALERRISQLNEGQANRRRDDDIVRLLGGEQRIVGDESDRN